MSDFDRAKLKTFRSQNKDTFQLTERKYSIFYTSQFIVYISRGIYCHYVIAYVNCIVIMGLFSLIKYPTKFS